MLKTFNVICCWLINSASFLFEYEKLTLTVTIPRDPKGKVPKPTWKSELQLENTHFIHLISCNLFLHFIQFLISVWFFSLVVVVVETSAFYIWWQNAETIIIYTSVYEFIIIICLFVYVLHLSSSHWYFFSKKLTNE